MRNAPTDRKRVITCGLMVEKRVVDVVGFEIMMIMKAVADTGK